MATILFIERRKKGGERGVGKDRGNSCVCVCVCAQVCVHACFHVVCVEFLTICICKESVTLSACVD